MIRKPFGGSLGVNGPAVVAHIIICKDAFGALLLLSSPPFGRLGSRRA
jgi:hypothetical protein